MKSLFIHKLKKNDVCVWEEGGETKKNAVQVSFRNFTIKYNLKEKLLLIEYKENILSDSASFRRLILVI